MGSADVRMAPWKGQKMDHSAEMDGPTFAPSTVIPNPSKKHLCISPEISSFCQVILSFSRLSTC